MLWLFVGPTGVYLLDFFYSGIQFYLLLSPYLCFISLLYLDLYVLGVEKSLKTKYALKSTGESLQGLEKSLNFINFRRTTLLRETYRSV